MDRPLTPLAKAEIEKGLEATIPQYTLQITFSGPGAPPPIRVTMTSTSGSDALTWRDLIRPAIDCLEAKKGRLERETPGRG